MLSGVRILVSLEAVLPLLVFGAPLMGAGLGCELGP